MAGKKLMKIDPAVVEWNYNTEYRHSYAQDSPFFIALGKNKLLGSRCPGCGYKYGTYRKYCMYCGAETEDIELPLKGKIHSFTTCYYSGESFRNDVPFTLVLVEFPGIDSLFMSRLYADNTGGIKIGMDIIAKFKKFQDFTVNDVYFVLA
ncbi:Zn-ribbon domain-containing OB-fold protein [Ferroplasma acidiphilum]|uniref:Zn-ribbon domain-containing OB-fold protein n=1 Tax=Ferroplasma acidiphilum TaxID=74969 RepID=UPI0028150021|nr:Zn-ribbon domain-containing OB-fold protein [Ferroplasma acidiphilum]WMT52506.1 MAG: Zn-ribbon domain-containing OB-fold protein [Ferroplasma acidiphilum]